MNRLQITAIALGVTVLVAGGAALALGRGSEAPSRAPEAKATAPAASREARARPPYVEAAGYPRPVLFRNGIETWGVRGVPVEDMLELAKPYDMVIAKALDEEVTDRAKVAPYMVAIKRAAPEKIVLDHFLLMGRNPKSIYPPVWPGHWLLLNGTTLATDLGEAAGDTTLVLTEGAMVAAGDDVQVMGLDAAGTPDYARVEQMRVVSVSGDRATVERGTNGTSRLRFEARHTRVAAHAAVTYNATTGPIWKYNFCREAPRDPSNRRLIEALAQPLAEYLKPGGILEGLDGYQFDVAAFGTNGQREGRRRLDCDNDGAPDSGYVRGVSSYGLGVVEFQSVLRGLVGERVLLISEATGWWSARDVAFANGMENESFPDLHHWEQFSSAYQRYQFWRETARAPRLSYLQLKETTEAFTRCAADDRGTNWKYRLSLGAALLGDGYFAYMSTNEFDHPECNYVDRTRNVPVAELEEFYAGTDKRYHYLGAPRGDSQRIDQLGSVPSLLTNGGFEGDTAGATLVLSRGAAATLTRDTSNPGEGSASLRVDVPAVLADPQDEHIRLRLGPFRVEKGREYTLRFRVRADAGYGTISPLFAEAPMRVAVNLTSGGQAPAEQDVMASRAWREYSLSFVAAADDAQANLFVLLGKEAGSVWLDALRLQTGPGDAFVRRFEHGAVLVNGSTSPATFDLSTLYPGTTFRRLRGTLDATFNNGAAVSGRVTLPGRDALILVDVKSLP